MLKSKDVVVINPKCDQQPKATMKSLKHKIDPAIFALSAIRNTKKGGVVVECVSSADCVNLKTHVAAELGEEYVISVPDKKCPRIRIYGHTEQLAPSDYIKVLTDQNPRSRSYI